MEHPVENPVANTVVDTVTNGIQGLVINDRHPKFLIHCMKCRAPTATLKDITLKRNIGSKYYVIGKCVHCGRSKSKQLNADERRVVPRYLLNMPINSSITMHYLSAGKALPLATLIPVLIGENVMGRGLEPTELEEQPLSLEELLIDAGYTKTDMIENV